MPHSNTKKFLCTADYLSAATLIARNVNSSEFDGNITYNLDGDMTSGDVEVFAAGMRNPYDLVFHSNGRIYGTDNGPNLKFGDQSVSCTVAGPGECVVFGLHIAKFVPLLLTNRLNFFILFRAGSQRQAGVD